MRPNLIVTSSTPPPSSTQSRQQSPNGGSLNHAHFHGDHTLSQVPQSAQGLSSNPTYHHTPSRVHSAQAQGVSSNPTHHHTPSQRLHAQVRGISSNLAHHHTPSQGLESFRTVSDVNGIGSGSIGTNFPDTHDHPSTLRSNQQQPSSEMNAVRSNGARGGGEMEAIRQTEEAVSIEGVEFKESFV